MTEGEGMHGFTAADAVLQLERAIGRRVDAVVFNEARPQPDVLERYRAEHKEPLDLGVLPSSCKLVRGRFWRKEMARHDRLRLGFALWAVLVQAMDSKY
jgi:2-phospho-L-lactate transferase/gluconeogenesis factor (CofD/UPF0052 family)